MLVNMLSLLFADDSILYREINDPNGSDQAILQEDLNKVFKWADKWQMSFNAFNCQALRITNKTKPMEHTYIVDGQHIDQTSNHKYLGVTITKKLEWKQHVQSITSSARRTLGILRRNISACPPKVKARAYKALVRPKLEFSSAAWNPYTSDQAKKLEGVQNQAARFVCRNYDRTASVTSMLQSLEWDSLATRRLLNQCSMFYKIHYGLVHIPFPSCVSPPNWDGGKNSHILGYSHIQSRINAYRYSFFVRTIPIWGRLPLAVVQAPSVKQFQAMALPVLRDMKPTTTQIKL